MASSSRRALLDGLDGPDDPNVFDPNNPHTDDPYAQVDPAALDPSRTSEGAGGWTGRAEDPNAWQMYGAETPDVGTADTPAPSPAAASNGIPDTPAEPIMQDVQTPVMDGSDGTQTTQFPTAASGTAPVRTPTHGTTLVDQTKTTAGPPLPPAPTPVPIPEPVPASPFNESIKQMLLSQLQGDLMQPETAESGDIAPAIQAFTTQSQREEQASRDQLAERAYAENGGSGLHSGAFDTALAKNREGMAGQRMNFVGNAVLQGAARKRSQLNQALQTATSFGLGDEAQKIQNQIALLDASLREQGLQSDWLHGNDRLAFDWGNLISQSNRSAVLAGLSD